MGRKNKPKINKNNTQVKMVERTAIDSTTSNPEIDLLTINEGMREQKMKENLERISQDKNDEPLPISVKNEKEAKAVEKIERELDEGVEYVNATKDEVKEKLEEKSEQFVEKGKDLYEQAKKYKDAAEEKVSEWSEEAKDKLEDFSDNAQLQMKKANRYAKSWWNDNIAMVAVGIIVAGSAYLMYKSLF